MDHLNHTEKDPRELAEAMASQWGPIYYFKLLFDEPVQMPAPEKISQGIAKFLGHTEPLQPDPSKSGEALRSYLLLEHPVKYKGHGELPAQVLIYGQGPFDRSIFTPILCSQFWSCPDPQGLLERCNYEIMASNFLSAGLPGNEMYRLLADYADALLELFPTCIALYFPHSQKLLPRAAFEQSSWHSRDLHFLDGGLNVRFFRIDGTEEYLVDTVGLARIGLPDLQCHFHTLKPDDVVRNLHNLAAYLFEQGDVIEDGETVEGVHPGDRWRCNREDSLIAPHRVVLDIEAGEFAAGNRG